MGENRKIIVQFSNIKFKEKILYINLRGKNAITKPIKGTWDKQSSTLIFLIPHRTKFDFKYNEKKFELKELKTKKRYIFSKKKKSNFFFLTIMSLTLFGGLTIFSVNLFSFKNEKGSMVNIGNINSPVNNTNITNNRIIDETKNWVVSSLGNNQIEIGCLTCRQFGILGRRTYFLDLPRVVKVNLKNGAILSEINIYSFNQNRSTILDLNSGKTNELGYHGKGIIGEEGEKNPMLGFLSTKASSTYSTTENKVIKEDKFNVNNIGKKKEFYVGFLQTYSTALYEKNQIT